MAGLTVESVATATPARPKTANKDTRTKASDRGDIIYVSDEMPGISRRRGRGGFRYLDEDGWPVRDAGTLARIRKLAIPPAWEHVWICPLAEGHLQAVGRDAKGRKQYRYHTRWREVRDQTKYERTIAFAQALPAIRDRVEHDLALPGLPREKVLAAVVRLLETTLVRVGNQQYAKENNSFGLTTMRDRHVKVDGSLLKFEFRGKSGKDHSVSLRDRRLARIVQRCQDVTGYKLFQYTDEGGERRGVESADVNAYLKEISGDDFTAKDFRTWFGTVLAAMALQEFETFESPAEAKRNLAGAVEAVAKHLGNTAATCRKCYVHPDIIDDYLDGSLVSTFRHRVEEELLRSSSGLSPEEAAVLALLRNHLVRRDAGNKKAS
jgi:DNA topoisomerase I